MIGRILIIFILMDLLAACRLFIEPVPKSWNHGILPRPLYGVRNFPPADTDYGLGFKHGCGAAWDAVSKGLLAEFSQKGLDVKKMGTSPDYTIGWGDGVEQCTYVLDWNVL